VVTAAAHSLLSGPELACAAMAHWAGERVGLHFIPPGQPWRTGSIESFNSRVRDECLNINMFWSLAQARVVVSDWKADYNHRRRHSALGYQAPAVYPGARTTNERLSLNAAPTSGASRRVLRAPGGPVDLDRYPLRSGLRVDQFERRVRAGVGE
jgi:Integrase core domain